MAELSRHAPLAADDALVDALHQVGGDGRLRIIAWLRPTERTLVPTEGSADFTSTPVPLGTDQFSSRAEYRRALNRAAKTRHRGDIEWLRELGLEVAGGDLVEPVVILGRATLIGELLAQGVFTRAILDREVTLIQPIVSGAPATDCDGRWSTKRLTPNFEPALTLDLRYAA